VSRLQKRQPRTWRTRTDPLTDVLPRVLEMLKGVSEGVGPIAFDTPSASGAVELSEIRLVRARDGAVLCDIGTARTLGADTGLAIGDPGRRRK
jgi:hypothetical protein